MVLGPHSWPGSAAAVGAAAAAAAVGMGMVDALLHQIPWQLRRVGE